MAPARRLNVLVQQLLTTNLTLSHGEQDYGVTAKLVDNGQYLFVQAFNLFFLFPTTLKTAIWIGFYHITLFGSGIYKVDYDGSY